MVYAVGHIPDLFGSSMQVQPGGMPGSTTTSRFDHHIHLVACTPQPSTRPRNAAWVGNVRASWIPLHVTRLRQFASAMPCISASQPVSESSSKTFSGIVIGDIWPVILISLIAVALVGVAIRDIVRDARTAGVRPSRRPERGDLT